MFVKYYTIQIIIPIELILGQNFTFLRLFSTLCIYLFAKKSCLNIHYYCTVSKCYRYRDCLTIYLYMFKIRNIALKKTLKI